jgi:hypothetical protein
MLPRLLHRAAVPAARIAAPLRSVPSRPAAWLSSLSPATAHRGWSVVPGPVPVPAALAVNGAAPSFEPLVPPTPRPAAKPRVELRSVNAVMRNIKGSPRKMNSIVRQVCCLLLLLLCSESPCDFSAYLIPPRPMPPPLPLLSRTPPVSPFGAAAKVVCD